MVEGHKQTTITCIWVAYSIYHCHIGFLMHHMVVHANRHDGVLAQVTRRVFSGNEANCSH
jgi:hypothetical protein